MPARTHAPKVFLADDSEAIRERVSAILVGAGMTVTGEGATPEACTVAILALRPDVVVLDVQLEGGSGLQVLRQVRACAPGIAFIVFSNNSGPAYRKHYLRAGAVGFLDKSTEFEQLARAVLLACRPDHD